MAVFLILTLIVITQETGVTVGTGHCVGKVRTGSLGWVWLWPEKVEAGEKGCTTPLLLILNDQFMYLIRLHTPFRRPVVQPYH